MSPVRTHAHTHTNTTKRTHAHTHTNTTKRTHARTHARTDGRKKKRHAPTITYVIHIRTTPSPRHVGLRSHMREQESPLYPYHNCACVIDRLLMNHASVGTRTPTRTRMLAHTHTHTHTHTRTRTHARSLTHKRTHTSSSGVGASGSSFVGGSGFRSYASGLGRVINVRVRSRG